MAVRKANGEMHVQRTRGNLESLAGSLQLLTQHLHALIDACQDVLDNVLQYPLREELEQPPSEEEVRAGGTELHYWEHTWWQEWSSA